MPVIKDLKNTISSCHTSVTRIFAKFNVDHTTLSKYSAPPASIYRHKNTSFLDYRNERSEFMTIVVKVEHS